VVWVFRDEEADDRNSSKLYVNGVLKYDSLQWGFTDPDDLLIGATRLDQNRSLKGALDEVLIFDEPLLSLADGSGDVSVNASAEAGSDIWKLYTQGGSAFVGEIPEPMTMLAVVLSVAGLGRYVRKRRRN
jgi:hypothetical protein